MILLYLTLFIINLILWQTILKVGHDSDEQMKTLMKQYEQGKL